MKTRLAADIATSYTVYMNSILTSLKSGGNAARGRLDSTAMPVQKTTYAELHCATNFSFLTGASHPEELVDRAAELGYAALAVTDECSLAGVVRAHVQAKERGLHLIIGSTVQLTTIKGQPHAKLVLLAQTRRGYGNLSEFITLARRRAEKGRYTAYVSDLQGKAPTAPHLAGLPECLALLIPSAGQSFESLFAQAMWLKTWFAGRAWIALELLHRAGDTQLLEKLTRLSDLTALPLVAAGDVLMHTRSRKILQDAVTAIRLNKPVHACGFELQGNAEQYLRSWEQLNEIYFQAFNAEARLGPGLRRDDSIGMLNRHAGTEDNNASPHVPCASSGIFASKGAPDKREGISYFSLSDRESEDATATINSASLKKLPALRTSALNAFSPDNAKHLQVLNETLTIASQCTFSLDELRYEYPEEIVPAGQTPATWLRTLVYQGAHTERYPQGIPPKIQKQIEHELALIADLQYEPYFLTVADIVQWARSQGILCQGRGSAANSVVCYCLAITEVDPARMSMLFERFISKERNEPPDIDVDFEHQRREEVIQYIYKKYGRHRAALTATVVSYRPRSAVRDVGKALGIDLDRIDRLSKSQHWFDGRRVSEERLVENGFDPASPVVQHWMRLTQELMGFPRHLSQHTGGFVIARDDLSRLVPIENAAMPDRCVIEWDKDDLDAVGLLKVDVLALGMLSAIRRALEFVGEKLATQAQRTQSLSSFSAPSVPLWQKRLRIQDIPAEDKKTYDMICAADTVGVFQIESRAQMSMLPRLKPRKFYDLVIEVAIVRPGPIQGGMVHPYLKRRNGEEEPDYPSDEVRPALERTLGVPIFQEQVMQVAILAADFTPGEADKLRRAMAAWKRKGGLGPFYERLTSRMVAKGYPQEFADRIFKQIEGFGEYGFPESHAASFALLVYVSCWLKCHHPDAFLAALLNSQPMGFYAPAQLVRDAREHGVTVLPVDVMVSGVEASLEIEKAFNAEARRSRSEEKEVIEPAIEYCDVSSRRRPGPSDCGSHARRTTLGPGLRRDDSNNVSDRQVITEEKNTSPHVPCASSGIFASKGAPDAWQGISHLNLSDRESVDTTTAANGSPLKKLPVLPTPSTSALDAFPCPNTPPLHPVRLGLNQVAGLSTDVAERIVQARTNKPFDSIEDLTRRAALSAHELQALAAADALSKLSGNRHQAAWDVAGIDTRLTPLLKQTSTHEAQIVLAAPTQGQDVVADYKSIGLSLKNHPLALLRERLKPFSIQPANILHTFPHGRLARASGLVTHRQRPETAKGTVFVTLEDETGQINVIIWPAVVDAQRVPLLASTLLTVYGTWQKQNGVTHLLATKLVDHSHLLSELLAGQDTTPIPVRSRNFR
jgi:error-prone DNA polymerase